MRRLVCLFALVACGDNNKTNSPIDARIPDGPPDAPADANPSDLIATAKMTADGGGLALPISYAMVTYLKPAIGNPVNDPAGFTIQAQQSGPAMFVVVDPATTTPPLARGDVVSFTVTDLETVGMVRRIKAISGLTRHSQGGNFAALSQDVTAAADLVTAGGDYTDELIDINAAVPNAFTNAGTGFEKSQITTTGIGTPSASFQLRVPVTLRDAIDMVPTCNVQLKDTPVGRFNTETQLAAFTASDVVLSGCPAPVVASAVDVASTMVRVTFSRRIDPASVMADGSQFTFDNGLVASAATVSGRSVTLTTGAQAIGTTYTVTVANTVKDLQGTVLGATNTATFQGFQTPASVRINEVNANIASGCDLIELRVTAGGTLRKIKVNERTGNTGGGELSVELPDVTVATNDIVVVHLNANSATCNPGTAANETTSITQFPVAGNARNYDTAWDMWSTDTGLTATDNVITVFDRLGTITDVVLVDDDMAGMNVAAASETAAAAAAAANQWQKVGGGVPATGFVDDDFRIHAVLDSDGTGTTNVGDTLRRVDDADDNDKADWAQGPHTWGLINAGQTAL